MVNALLVYPKNPITFWSFDESLKIAGKKSAFPPNGLLTVAGMLPDKYDVKLVDTNVSKLEDKDLEWADVVLSSGMIIHWDSLEEIIKRANEAEKPIMAGGPLSTQYHHKIKGNATFFRGEAETGYLDELEKIVAGGYREGREVIDRSGQFVSMEKVPLQRFDLIKETMKKYGAMAMQITRGCPKTCTFCNIPFLYGKESRLKNTERITKELDMLYNMGWKGTLMIVDDNIVGNQKAIIPILKELEKWQKERDFPFSLVTQASLYMYESEELMESMYKAGFSQVFIGIESPSKESLKFMGAQKNLQGKNERGKRPMLEKILDIQENYFKVTAGFILGLDTDPDDIAELMKEFIQESRIGVAMVGPLVVLPDTPDYTRYSMQGRLPDVRNSGNTGTIARSLNYIPQDRNGNRIDPQIILDRHRDVLEFIYDPKNVLNREIEYLRHRKRRPLPKGNLGYPKFGSFLRSIWYQGLSKGYRGEYFSYLYDVFKNDKKNFADSVGYAIRSHHLITTTRESLKANDLNTYIDRIVGDATENYDRLKSNILKNTQEIRARYRDINVAFREMLDKRYRMAIESTLRPSSYET